MVLAKHEWSTQTDGDKDVARVVQTELTLQPSGSFTTGYPIDLYIYVRSSGIRDRKFLSDNNKQGFVVRVS